MAYRLLAAELRQSAESQLTGTERPLQVSELVENACARKTGVGGMLEGTSRLEFLGMAAGAMRRALVEIASRGAPSADVQGRPCIELLDDLSRTPCTLEQLLRIDEALQRLAFEDPQAAGIVERRLFAGMSVGDAGASLRLSRAIASQAWSYGRAWLQCDLNGPPAGASDASSEATRSAEDHDRDSFS
ncbi:MAG: ECF-type sigma factor [Maioricimonas sp. JB049]